MQYATEINITYNCNLKCEYCSHLSKYMTGYVPLEEIEKQYAIWSSKIQPETFRILGGEPCMHPDLASVIQLTRQYWRHSNLRMTTNGLLLHRCSPTVFTALKSNGMSIILSQHKEHWEGKEKEAWTSGIELLSTHGISYVIIPCWSYWWKTYRLDLVNGKSRILPFFSNSVNAWEHCCVKHGGCLTILDNLLYRCSQIALFTRGYKIGLLGEEWKFLLNYNPLYPDASHEQVDQWLLDNTTKSDSACCMCPEVYEHGSLFEKFPNPRIALISCRHLMLNNL